jgi:hypothetical protein
MAPRANCKARCHGYRRSRHRQSRLRGAGFVALSHGAFARERHERRALGLFARAIGEFKYVGFFKRVRGSRFARRDTLLYSPLCLWLAAGVAFVAWQHGI